MEGQALAPTENPSGAVQKKQPHAHCRIGANDALNVRCLN